MGNTMTQCGCSRPSYRGGDDSRAEIVARQKTKGTLASITYTEWEEIIALSRAIHPGGKLLGLSSTKKLLGCSYFNVVAGTYAIDIWELHRVGSSTASDFQVSTTSAPKQKPILELAATFNLSVASEVGQIKFLDSAKPRYIIGCFKYSPAPIVPQSKPTQSHALRVWLIKPSSADSTQPQPRTPYCLEAVNDLIGHDASVSVVYTVRDIVVSGDSLGGMIVWVWDNWRNVEWRRVSSRRTSRGVNYKPLLKPTFHILHKVSNAHEKVILGMEVVHAKSDTFQIYTTGADNVLKLWVSSKSHARL